jgi:hypothetical protein
MENQNQEPVELSAEEVRAKVKQLMDEWKMNIIIDFVPQSKSRNAGKKDPQLNWVVRMGRLADLGKTWTLVTDYSQGIHAPGYEFAGGRIQEGWRKRYFAIVAEQGEYVKKIPKLGNGVTDFYSVVGDDGKFAFHGSASLLKRSKDGVLPLPKPHVGDVLYSLIMDSDALDYSSFEEWTDNLGYDPDSRSAEKIYKSCMEIALKMRSLFGEERLSELRTLFENY